MKKLKAGIIGLGVGAKHIDGYLNHPQVEVSTVCDLSEETLKQIQKKYPKVKAKVHADEVLEDPQIDIVSIASYDDAHFSQVMKAIEHDKHIFVEKPICLFEKELVEIRAALEKKPHLQISSNLILRMSPRFQWLKQKIQEKKLGELYYLEGDYNYGRIHKITDGWRGKMDFYSVVYGGGIHMLDLMLWLSGDEVVEVSALGNAICSKGSGFRFNDMVVCLLKFKSGLVGKMSVNYGCVHPHYHALSVYGTQGTFINDSGNAKFFDTRGDQVKPKEVKEEYPGTQKGDMIPSFVNLILNGAPAEVSKEDVFKTMSVCLAIEKAVNKGCSVPVKYF
jgi:predicted dehydrogenase